MQNNIQYGNCPKCLVNLKAEREIVNEEKLVENTYMPTGKLINMVDYLYCPQCLKKYTVDDSFDYYIK